VKVDEWVFWQMANFGPNAGQRNHFRNYAPSIVHDQRQAAYGAIRYTNEVERLYGVLNKQLDGQDFITGEYTIADMITWPWVQARSSSALDLDDFQALKAWQARVAAREAVARAMARARDFMGVGLQGATREASAARSVLFGQRART
jgi:glutathione S-transferase